MTDLRAALDQLRDQAKAQTPEATRAIEQEAMELLARTGTRGRTVKIGEAAPDFSLEGADGKQYSLAELRSHGPVIVSFFRGGWCPYCSIELRAYQQLLQRIEGLGASMVALSPDRPEHLRETVTENELAYPVLSDRENETARAYGLVYEVPLALRSVYEGFGLDLATRHGAASAELPVPATYLVDTRGIVQRAFVENDYSQRGEPTDFVDGLEDLSATG